MKPNSPLLPQTRIIVWDDEMAQKEPVKYLRALVNDLGDMYTEIAAKHNLGPEYQAAGIMPVPAKGQFMVWKDLATNRRWLLYNDNGKIVKFAETP